ncbi:hypothetical protein [Streptomyces sp. NBC_00878]|uniref:hypothetical protein n=1 Tax=Streptomyces sp. NBC_00878 TaxID=2975854 RepID=UPI00224CFA87|nr:hypothetical protein [Streptomyces sp. NBC_00878]MCX4906593.1 hypothetical protein [Streptomyces sp. NBC_00878]
MIDQDPGSGLCPDPLEQRLRDALRARTEAVGRSDLRPAAPPSWQARFRLPGTFPACRAVGLFVLAAVVAGLLFVAARWERETPVHPTNVPTAPPTPEYTDTVDLELDPGELFPDEDWVPAEKQTP